MFDLIRSRRFQAALAGLVVAILIHLLPSLEGSETELSNIVAAFILALLGSYTADHASYNLGKGKSDSDNKTISDLSKDTGENDG